MRIGIALKGAKWRRRSETRLSKLNENQSSDTHFARVFVVDDDNAVRTAISFLVRSCGWQAVPCNGGQEFFEHYSPSTNLCVVLDLQMPCLSGEQVLRKLRGDNDDVPVVVVTAHLDETITQRVYQHGVLAVLHKPSAGSELEMWLRHALKHPKTVN